MDHPELIHQIFLHLPLNIFWRIAGWSTTIDKVLRKEQFWKEKCEREFHLLPQNIGVATNLLSKEARIDSYRIYYMIRTRNVKGDLYPKEDTWSGTPLLRGINSIVADPFYDRCFVVLHGSLHQISSKIPIVHDSHVTSISYKKISKQSFCWVRKSDGSNRLLNIEGNNAHYVPFPIPSSPTIIDWAQLENNKYLVLNGDGELLLVTDTKEVSVVKTGVLQFLVFHLWIIVSYADGFIEVMNRDRCSSLRLEHPHLQIQVYDTTLMIQRLDGTMEFFEGYKSINLKNPYESRKLSTPLRDYYHALHGRSSDIIITTIDGRARLDPNNDYQSLLGGYQELKYYGLVYYDHLYLLANKVRLLDQ